MLFSKKYTQLPIIKYMHKKHLGSALKRKNFILLPIISLKLCLGSDQNNKSVEFFHFKHIQML